MPRYSYTAKTQPNNIIQGDIEAESEQDAINKLTKMGYFPISLGTEDLSRLGKFAFFKFRKISNKDIVLFTSQLSSLIQSGVNILNGLNIISKQTTNKYLQLVINDVISKIKDGSPLSESLAHYPDLFSSLYTSMVHSGEVGGTLEETLARLSDFLEKEEEFKNSIKAALTYPLFVFFVGTLTVVALLGFVIPRLVTMFEDMGQLLPLPTRMLIGLSDFIRSFWWIIVALIVVSTFLLRRFHRSPEGRFIWDSLKLKIYFLGQITLKSEISRLMRTLSLLLSSGITIISALDVSMSVIENQILISELKKIKNQISSGLSLSQCLKDSGLFPDLVINIASVGEETGTLEKSLMRIAVSYERDVDRTLKALSRMLEPVIILIMGLVVGFIVLSMLLPIFQINLIVR